MKVFLVGVFALELIGDPLDMLRGLLPFLLPEACVCYLIIRSVILVRVTFERLRLRSSSESSI